MEIAIGWIICGVIAAVIASNKGHGSCGWFAVGVLLGPIGIIFALVVKKDEAEIEKKQMESGTMKKCPQCAEMIKKEASKCRYCGADVTGIFSKGK